MLQLTSDPQSIRFLQGNRISLPLLKNQIDRRLLKITCLVKKMDRKRQKSHQNRQKIKQEHKNIQTQCSLIDKTLGEREEDLVLVAINEKERNNRGIRIGSDIKGGRYGDGSSRAQRNKGSHLKNQSKLKKQPQQNDIKQSLQHSVSDHPLIQSNGFTFRDIQQTHEGSTNRKQLQQSQDDKIFESLDFELQISNVDMCNSITSQSQLHPYRTAIATREPRSDLQTVSPFTDLSGSELGKEVSRRNRKIRMAGREVVLPEPQKRIIVSQQCKEKMSQEVEALFGRKRKEVWDYKSRVNVLKKIEEKYGEEYSA